MTSKLASKIIMIRNTQTNFGLLTRLIHWLSALTIFGLFGVGYWMVDLSYYSEWYQTAPHWHESVGILLLVVTVFRLVWKTIQITPKPLSTHSASDQKKAKAVHYLLYLLMFTLFITGYLIPTADDRSIEVFSWFALPSIGALFDKQEDIAGTIHEYGAYTLIAIAVLHALAALKHHFIDKDETLKRMVSRTNNKD